MRPVRTRLFSAAFVAVLASCTGSVFPLVLKWMVDGPVAEHDAAGIWLGALYLLLLGIAEAVLFGLRRAAGGAAPSGRRATCGADLYLGISAPAPRRLPRPPGPPVSCCPGTTDLMLVRQFLAFPLRSCWSTP